jgi:hypothetical protein
MAGDNLVEAVARALREHSSWSAMTSEEIGADEYFGGAARAAVAVVMKGMMEEVRAPGDLGDFTTKYIRAFAKRHNIEVE